MSESDVPRPHLKRQSHNVIEMGAGWFSWIHVKSLAGPTQEDDAAGLMALVHDRHYRDTYITAGSQDDHSTDVHGPYLLSRISRGSFEELSKDKAEKLIRGFATNREMPALYEQELARAVLRPIRRSSSVFRLRELGQDAFYDCGWILDHFCELVAITDSGSLITLIVMGAD